MSRERLALAVSLALSVVMHFTALFRLYVNAETDRPYQGDGRVALVRAVLMEPPSSVQAAPAGAAGAAPETPPPPDEAQMKLQKTEAAPPEAPPPPVTPSQSISTIPEITTQLQASAAEPAGSAAEVSETPGAGGSAGGEPSGAEFLITHVPPAPEPAAGGNEPSRQEPDRQGGKAAARPAGGTAQEEGLQKGGRQSATPQDLPEAGPFVPVYRVDTKPELIQKAALSYPAKARELNIQGTVILEVSIDEKGMVSDIRIVKGVGFGLDEEAARWMRASQFSPARVQDKAVAVKMQYPVTFKIK